MDWKRKYMTSEILYISYGQLTVSWLAIRVTRYNENVHLHLHKQDALEAKL